MGRAPCCDKATVKRGPWSPEEDAVLRSHIEEYGTGGNWITLPKKAGLNRCGKSCRLRWLNYLRPGIKHGGFTEEEDNIICSLYRKLGSRWSVIASHLRGRTDNDVKNYWNTKLKKKLLTPTIITSIIPSPTPASLLPTVKAEPYNNPSDISRSIDSIFALTQDSHEFYSEPSPLPRECRAKETGQLHRHSRSEEVSAPSSTFTVDDGSRNSYGNWSASGAGPYDLFLSELDIEYLIDLLGDDGSQAEMPQGLHRSVAYW